MNTLGNRREVFGFRKDMYKSVSPLFGVVRRSELEMLQEYWSHMSQQSMILEVGCGTGFLSQFLIQKGFVVDGIDFEFSKPKGVRKYWQEDLRERWPADIKFKAYDLVISLASMHHIALNGSQKPPTAFISGALKSLRPNGSLVICDVARPQSATLACSNPAIRTAKFFQEVVDTYTVPPHCGEYLDRNRTQNALIQLGFKCVCHKYVHCPWLFKSHDEMCAFIKILFNLTDITDKYLNKILNSYIGISNHVDGCIELNWGLQVFSAIVQDHI